MKWTTEELTRVDRKLLIIYADDETRGSVSLEEEELELWRKAIEHLNSLEDGNRTRT